jgi:hypothetical protein
MAALSITNFIFFIQKIRYYLINFMAIVYFALLRFFTKFNYIEVTLKCHGSAKKGNFPATISSN